jgi:hypothetical protein
MLKHLTTKKIITSFKKENPMRHVTKNLLLSLIALLFAFSGCSDSNNHKSDQQSKPEITALDNLPETTARESVSITLYGTADRDVYINNVKTARTDKDGVATVALDTSGTDGERRFTIFIRDDQGNESDAYIVTIVKDADYVEPAVPAKAVAKLTLSATVLDLDENGTAAVSVTAAYKDGTTEEVTPKVIWVVSDTSVATVHSDGTVRANCEGTVTLKAKYGANVSPQLTLTVYKEIHGHRLPPEPDPEVNNATLLGIDSNNNGVRDDVERYIYTSGKYDQPVVRAVALQTARAFQIVISDPSRARETVKYMHAAIDCQSYYMFYADRNDEQLCIDKNRRISNEIAPLQFNSEKRKDAYMNYNRALSGGMYTATDDEKLKSQCDFNATLLMEAGK